MSLHRRVGLSDSSFFFLSPDVTLIPLDAGGTSPSRFIQLENVVGISKLPQRLWGTPLYLCELAAATLGQGSPPAELPDPSQGLSIFFSSNFYKLALPTADFNAMKR